MTIIAHCAVTNRVFVDSQSTYFNGRPSSHQSKIESSGDLKFAVAGSTLDHAFVRAHIEEACLKGKPVKLECEDGASGIARNVRTGEVFSFAVLSGHLIVAPIREMGYNGHAYAEGSGSAWFYGYYHAKLGSVEHCVQLVAKYHAECGGEVESF